MVLFFDEQVKHQNYDEIFLTELSNVKTKRKIKPNFCGLLRKLYLYTGNCDGCESEREGGKNEKCIEVWTSSRITEKLADDINKVKFHMI